MSEATNKVVVTLKIGVDVDAFIDEMSNVGNVSPHVPNRAVEIFNLKEDSLRNVDFTMTLAEMEELLNDPRVFDCRWGTKLDNGFEFSPIASDTRKTYRRDGTTNNWGIIDCVNNNNPFTTESITSNYNYNLDGTDVDVIISDTGININHDEFKDAKGVSRVKKIDWWTDSGLSGTRPWTPDSAHMNMPTGFYSDTNGHGTHVASTVAGLNVGWAKNANIYVMKIALLGAGFGGLPTDQSFNLIRAWHENKSINPKTGRKNPTIVNMSWSGVAQTPGSLLTSTNQNFEIRESGVTRNVTDVNLTNYRNKITTPYGIWIQGNGFPSGSLSSLDANMVDAMLSGVIFVGAAGNDFHPLSKYNSNTSNSYNDYIRPSNSPNRYYYRRGPGPGATELSPDHFVENFFLAPYIAHYRTICVGATAIPPLNTNTGYTKASFSNSGNRIDVYAPGTSIYGADNDSNSSYLTLQGTSMASPQVCGVIACVLQANPYFTQEDAILWLQQNSNITKMTDHTGDGSWNDTSDVQGSELKYLNMPYRSGSSGTITSN